jgi:hypothetical protein
MVAALNQRSLFQFHLSKATGIVSVSWNGMHLAPRFPIRLLWHQYHSKTELLAFLPACIEFRNWMLTNNKLICIISLSARLSIDLNLLEIRPSGETLVASWIIKHLWHDYPNAQMPIIGKHHHGRILTHGWNSNSIFNEILFLHTKVNNLETYICVRSLKVNNKWRSWSNNTSHYLLSYILKALQKYKLRVNKKRHFLKTGI